MSITFRHVRKLASFSGGQRPVLDGADFFIDQGMRVGILSAAKPEHTIVLRLMCGTDVPDGGTIQRSGRISWPIPQATVFNANSTVALNIRFMARLYGVRDDDFPHKVVELVQISEFANRPLKMCPGWVKQRLALALGIAMDFDIYLFDGSFAPVDKEFKKSAPEIVSTAVAGRGVVLATSIPSEVEQNCESAYVLADGQLRFFAQAGEAVQYYKQLGVEQKQRQSRGEAQTGEDIDLNEQDDIDVLGTAVSSVIE